MKLQTFWAQFETLKMKEEDISTYFIRVDEMVNFMDGIGATIEEKLVL